MSDRRSFDPEEDEAIIQLVKKLGTKRWAEVAQRMSERYGLPERTGKQCRERWHNHLDPNISKRPWSEEEERTIFMKHRECGNKWTEITKHLPGRTDNSVKNHFYSTLRKGLRRINKVLGSTNSTIRMRSIKPCVLSQVLNGFGEDSSPELTEACFGLQTYLLQFSRNKPTQEILNDREKRNFEAVIEKIIDLNDQQIQRKGLPSIRRRKGRRVPTRRPRKESKEEESVPILEKEEESHRVSDLHMDHEEENYSRIYQLLEGMNNHEDGHEKKEDLELEWEECNLPHHGSKLISKSPWMNMLSPARKTHLRLEDGNFQKNMDGHLEDLKKRLNQQQHSKS